MRSLRSLRQLASETGGEGSLQLSLSPPRPAAAAGGSRQTPRSQADAQRHAQNLHVQIEVDSEHAATARDTIAAQRTSRSRRSTTAVTARTPLLRDRNGAETDGDGDDVFS